VAANYSCSHAFVFTDHIRKQPEDATHRARRRLLRTNKGASKRLIAGRKSTEKERDLCGETRGTSATQQARK